MNDDWMIENDYEEIYNGEGRTAGEAREYYGQSGRFYQTYGNGGGPGGWGGYWIKDGDTAVWKVEGHDFTYMPGKTLSLLSVPYFPASLHWWCKLTDEIKCPNCEQNNRPLEFKTDLGQGDVMVCEECYDDLEGEEIETEED